MHSCSADGNPAFGLSLAPMFLLIAVLRTTPGLQDVSARVFYGCAGILAILVGWFVAGELCDPRLYTTTRIRIVVVHALLAVACGAFIAHLRRKEIERRKRKMDAKASGGHRP